jgi:uncharacterized repeat protein (TIGR01451 family)
MRRPALLTLGFLMLFAATATKAQMPNTITTVAGGGTNSGAANAWTLTQPPDAVRDAAGNTYISDPILCVVYKVDTTGALSIYAGNGIFGVGGDGGPATSAGLTLPEGLALDAKGNLFIADYLNNRIRRVDVNTHIITTVAGSEDPFVGGYAGDGGLATLARLNLPFAVAVDKNGNLFISDSGNNVVRRVDAQTQIITTYAGNGLPGTPGTPNGDGGAATAAQLNLPVGLVTDGNDNLYIADSQHSVIRLVNAQTQIITTYAGSPATQGTFGGDNGPATSAGLNTPSDIFLDNTGNLYIADTKNQRIRFVDNTTNHIITTIVGNGTLCMNPASACGDGATATAAMLNHPTSVFLDSSGKLLIADQGDQRIRVVSAGTISNFAGGGSGGDGGAATSAILGLPNSLVADGTGNLFVLEQLGERVRRVDATTHNISTYAGTGARGERLSSNGDGGQAVNANFVEGFGIAIDGPGNIYVVDERAAVVRKIDATTKIITTVAGNGLRCGEPGNAVVPPACGDGGAATSASLLIPVAIALDSGGDLYISDIALNTIRMVNSGGTIQTFAGTPGTACTTYTTTHCGDGGPPTQALLNGPFGLAAGPSVQFEGATDVFVADSNDNVIRKIDGEFGTISTYAFNGFPGFSGDGFSATAASMTGAQQVALDDKENLYIGGGIDNVVRRVDQFDQSIITVAGDIENLGGGFSGDGGPSTKALIGNLGSAIDKSHNLYIADGFQRVRKVNLLPVATESGTFTAFPPTLNGVSLADATTQEVSFSNTGLDDLILTITSPVLPSAFQVGFNCTPIGTVPCTITVPPGESGFVDVTFLPPVGGPTGPLAATLTVTTNDPANPSFNFPLSGTATNTSFALNVTIAPTGSGTVFSSPSGISCGTSSAPVCSANFAQNSQVTLTAFPNTGFSFMGWSGAGCSGTADCVVTMTQAQNVTATFATGGGGPSAVTVSAIGNGSGTIMSNPPGINCSYNGTATSGTCSFNFPSATQVTLTATAVVPGSSFAGWLGFCSTLGTNTCQTFAAGLTTTAVFSVLPQAFTQGEVFAGAAGGMIFVYKPNGTLAQVLGSGNLGGNIGGIAFDTSGNLYAANPSARTGSISGTVERFGSNGSGPTTFGTGPTGNGYDASPQSVVLGPDGSVYVAQSAGRGSLLKFAPAGGAATFEFFPPTDSGPINWIELLDDNDTILYTTGVFGANGGKVVKAFDTGDNIYLPDFAQNLPGAAAFGLRELPDKTVLVADGDRIVRVNPSGAVTQTYTIGTGGLFHSLNLDPDGVTFWTLEDVSGTMYRINIATGAMVTSFSTGVGLTLGAFNGFQGGLAVFGQPQSGGADVQVTMSAAPNPVGQNSNVTYTITVMNNGVLSAANVAMTDAFPAGVTFVSAMTSVGMCTGTTTVTCNLGTMANQALATISIVVKATQAGTLVNTVNVTSTTPDPITSNNTATTSTTVTGSAATHFSVTAPTTATAGTAFNITVTALDATNAVVTGYAGTVHFTSSDTIAVLPANSTLTNGVGTFAVTLKTAGSQTITATDTVTGTITGMSGTITVTSIGPTATLAISKTHAGNFTQGQHSAQYTVTVSNAPNGAPTSGTVTVTDTALSALAQDFAASFSGASNPNGVWSYGQFVESTSTFTLLPGQNAAFPTCGLPYWSGTGYPDVIANNSGSTVSCGTVTVPNDTLWMHPTNTAGTDSDVRWTAPASGTYEITGSFSALDSTSTLDSILVNGTPVFSTFICNPGNGNTCGTVNTRAPFSVVKTLGAGSTVDFIVNCCSGADQTFLFDSTGLSGAIDANLSGLSLVSMSGTGWTCGAPNPANTCTRSDALAPGASYPPITVLVNVGVNASSPQVNTVSVSGGGSATANASDSTVITPAPSAQLTITKTHTGNFTQGQQGAQYNLTVANSPGAAPTSGTLAQADSTTVQSTGSIYDTGGGSTAPTMITLPSGATSVVFTSVTGSITMGCASTEGCIVLNNGTGNNANDPDGVGAAPATSSNTGTSSISGITGPGAGYLVGVFVPVGGPVGTAPTALDFTSSGLGTSFTSLSPQLDQVFFIGDGLTGNGTGTQQTFNIPTGAGQLWLGISDAGFYNGAPGAYGDNLGFYTVDFTVNAPSSGGVTVTETAPAGLTLVSMAGTGWTCGSPNPANVCTRSDALAAGGSYPVITVTVNVAANATSPQVNTAAVTGGGSAQANASDSTVIVSTAGTQPLTVITAGTGTGMVTGAGINCVSGSANGCTASLAAGTQVVLTQGVTNGSTFAGWNGAPTMCTVAGTTCTFTMPAAAETVTATFTAGAAILKSIAVTPANPTEPISSSLQFTATGTYSDNSMKDITSTVAWASSNTQAATISTSGLAMTGNTPGLTTTISASLNEVTGSTLLTISSSPISISVTPPPGGTFPPVPPGGRLAIGIVLTSTPGFTGTVTFSCTTSSPTITCAPDPASVTLTPAGPTDVAIVLNTFCTGTTTAMVGPVPGGVGGGIALLLISLTVGGVAWMWRRNRRWAVSFAILVLMAIGGAACSGLPKGPNGATPPGNYTVTFKATVNGVTTSTAPIPFTVE